MPLEVATYISGLDPSSPTSIDLKSQGDDHIRLLKTTLRATFPNINSPVTATPAQINRAATTSWVEQGGGAGQLANPVYIGWGGASLKLQVDSVNYSDVWPISIMGQANSARYAAGGYLSSVSAGIPSLEVHKPGVKAAAWFLNNVNRLACGLTGGDGNPTSERFTHDLDNGNTFIAGTLTQASDERLKKNWRPLVGGFVAALAGVKSGVFERIDTGDVQVGVSAQSLRAVLPEAVQEDAFGGELSVAYGNAALAACIELAKELVKLRAEVAALKAAL